MNNKNKWILTFEDAAFWLLMDFIIFFPSLETFQNLKKYL